MNNQQQQQKKKNNNVHNIGGSGKSRGSNINNTSNKNLMKNREYNVGVDSGRDNANSTNTAAVGSIREICNSLQPNLQAAGVVPEGTSPYDHIVNMMQGLDLGDDGIIMNKKIKAIETDFCTIVRDEHMLCESMDYINDRALTDGQTALKFAILFSSRNFDVLAMKEIKVRSAMLKILETNFLNAETYRLHDRERFFNSITLLGEYYHRVRLADNTPITILGESLVGLLCREVVETEVIEAKVAKLVLSQITLNGDNMRVAHKDEITKLLYHIRRHLIEQPVLKPAVRALLLMTLDLYYNNFNSLGQELTSMYTKYLLVEAEEEEDEVGNLHEHAHDFGNNNLRTSTQSSQHFSPPKEYQLQQQQQEQQKLSQSENVSYARNKQTDSVLYQREKSEQPSLTGDDSFDSQPSTKKWSEQICEESWNDNEYDAYNNHDGLNWNAQENQNQKGLHEHKIGNATNRSHTESSFQHSSNANERFKQPQKQFDDENDDDSVQKPFPRWRSPLFKSRLNNDNAHNNTSNARQRTNNNRIDDDHSVCSEGIAVKLYSVNDRLKHDQDKFDEINTNQYNSIANSNWDRQSQRDDRSERSYISNYERGQHNRHGGGPGGNRHYNQRQQIYDKPPRFQKHHQQQHERNRENDHDAHNKDRKIRSDSWRRSYNNNNSGFNNKQHNYKQHHNAVGAVDEEAARSQTLPRSNNKTDAGGSGDSSNRRRSQSPSRLQGCGVAATDQSGYQRRARNFTNGRYGSQSSLISEGSNAFDRRKHQQQHQHQRNRNNFRRQGSSDRRKSLTPAEDWDKEESQKQKQQHTDSVKSDNELVRNAQQTTKYMNYLSSKQE